MDTAAPPTTPPPRATAPRDDAEPRTLGRFRILRRLGDGGMSSVYLAYDPQERRPVALKVLADHLSHDRDSTNRFLREAQFGQTLRFPHLIRTLGSDRDPASGRPFLVLEYVDGPSCQFLLDRTGPLAVRDAVRIALDAAMALEYLDGRRLVHRDIKPGNILLTTSGVAKLGDLGLAKRIDDTGDLTALHQGFGTSWYMPLEQVKNARFVDGRSDVFALGATLYHLLTGRVPFPGANHAEVVARKSEGAYTVASELNHSVPSDLDGILARMLAREPQDRFATASDLVVALERSQLADKLPSFVDLELALQDPEARARLTSNGQATSPDLRPTAAEPATAPEKSSPTDVWHLRFRDPRGQWIARRATTNQVLHGLREGYWPAGVEAARGSHRRFRPIEVYREFRGVTVPAVPAKPTPAPAAESRLTGLRHWKMVLSTGFGLGLLAAASVAALCRLFMHL
jgi:eukaryotic-like serine/threonine-protein kinase